MNFNRLLGGLVCLALMPALVWGAPDTLQLRIGKLPAASKASLDDLQSRPFITAHPGWYSWCPSVLQAADGKYHMFHARWPQSLGFLSWLTHSQVVHAVADRPEGPYTEVGVAIPATGPGRGDWFNAHNAKIKRFGDTYYLYFIQTRGDSFAVDGEAKRVAMARVGYRHPLWMNEARPNQRTFVATAKSLDGPWSISPDPIIQPAKTITTLTVNPAVCQGPDGTYFMIVKGDKPGSRARNQALAIANSPVGPWTIQDAPVIDDLDTEDASIWYDQTRKRFYAVFHARGFLGMMTSPDGYHWEKAAQYKLTPKEIVFDDGTTWKPDRMERPFVLTDDRGQPQQLFVACKRGDTSVNVCLPLFATEDE
ncbi:glycoside hydrolase family protein [Aeoliella sp. ICT_H6.2]|uniref:Glycoside hydrolase family protein n=1 Tax=Aeoliella straminimaris TaxID=2954799 RepID=A0A9X2F7S5_9BACT|nr:glycoside hydrolase family protein [Aeoliella straminimaris]MCO6043208.1 glycoside hydrolase family protein [Aeoliella straminimaris]